MVGSLLLAALLAVPAWQITNMPKPAQEVGTPHIEANVPSDSDFDRFALRDLEHYFKTLHFGRLSVSFELLERKPTQSGVAYPSFHAWVEVHRAGKVIDAGAVRLEAIEKTRFEVADYLSVDSIRETPGIVSEKFPASLTTMILDRAGVPPQP